MGVSPIIVSRTSSSMQRQVLLKGMRTNMASLLKVQSQLATGLRIMRPSDDPIDATAALRLEEVLESQRQYLQNIDNAAKSMNVGDATLGSLYEVAISAHDTVLANIGSTASSEQRKMALTDVENYLKELVTLGNTEYLGNYMFAGTLSNVAPFSLRNGGVRFDGNQNAQTLRVSDAVTMQMNLTAAEVFGSGSGVITSDHRLAPAAEGTTRLSDLDGAINQGIRLGTLMVQGSVIGNFNVDLTGSATIDDIIDKVNAELPASVRMSLDSNGRRLVLTSANAGEMLFVDEAGQGTIAHDLGLYADAAAVGPIIGGDFGNRIVPQAPVTVLAENVGIDLASGIIISNGNDAITINFSAAETVQDIISIINAAGINIKAEINEDGTGIEIINLLAGSELRIGENGGTTAADLGVRTFRGDTELDSLNGGLGVGVVDGDDFRIITADGSTVDVDISSAETIQDVIDAINTTAALGGVSLSAGLATTGSGIVLTDNTGGAGQMSVERLNSSYAPEDLGILTTAEPGSNEINGQDVVAVKEESLFTYLLDLQKALYNDDTRGIEQAGVKIEEYTEELATRRGKLGYMARALDTRFDRLADAILSTESLLSGIKDLDFTEGITRFQQLQTTLQANLMSGGQILNISLLDFLR